jgi:3-hydroxyisobutyrate dehydrogenase
MRAGFIGLGHMGARGDYDDSVALALACKDLGLAVDLARDVGVPAEVSALVEQIYRRARAQYGDSGGECSPSSC